MGVAGEDEENEISGLFVVNDVACGGRCSVVSELYLSRKVVLTARLRNKSAEGGG